MVTIAFALPCLPGGATHLRDFSQELNGSRRKEFEDFNRRLGLNKHNCYIQSSPQGDLSIIYLESEDLPGAFQYLAMSEHPFDVWFRDQAKLVHGVDFTQPMPGPLPEVAFASGQG
jgi:hypothetical protein